MYMDVDMDAIKTFSEDTKVKTVNIHSAFLDKTK